MSISEEHIIQRNGKPFVLFAGLLDLAHREGLASIETELLQVPDESNHGTAICKATVTMEDNRTFDGIGDAASYNAARAMHPHLIRLAETRAKARALRDATNVGVAAVEELGGGE